MGIAFLLIVFFGLVIVPLGAILKSVSIDEFFSPDILSIVVFSLQQASLSLLFSVVFGILLGEWAYRRGGRFTQQAFLFLYSMPTLSVTLAVALTFKAYGLFSVVFTHAWINSPWIALRWSEGRRLFPQDRKWAARSLGATAAQVFWDHEWPFLRARILLASCQVFSVCVMSFTIVLLLGGGPPIQTLETEIYSSLKMGEPNFLRASTFAIWQMLLTFIPTMFIIFFKSPKDRTAVISVQEQKKSEGWIWFLFFPFAALFYSLDISESLGAFNADALAAAWVSFQIALPVAVAVVLLAGFVARISQNQKWLFFLFQIPAGVSALVLGLGFWLAYAEWLDPFSGSRLAMILIQTVLILPLGVRTFWPLVREKNQPALDAARLMGATSRQAWFLVEWPRWNPAVSSLVMVSIIWSMGELATVSLFSSEDLVTLPLLISRWMGQYRFDQAIALSLLLVGGAWIIFSLQMRWEKKNV